MSDLHNLNPEQKEAVLHDAGPLLIVAGAGTGKTTVLINRLLHLVTEKKVDPDNILITTFTEKAAGEMIERADKALPYGYVNLWINTFHGLCETILRNHGLDIGLPTDFKIINQTEQWVLIKQNMDKLQLDYYRPLGNPNKFIQELIKHFSHLKDENITAQEYLEYAESIKQDEDNMLSGQDEGSLDVDRINELANAYHVYNQLLLDSSYLDFGDLICYTLKLFKERPDILRYYQEKFKYIMVDEFQDTNWSQYELIKMLAKPDNSLVAVGDDDQAIYRFRGASLSNILQFKNDYPDAKEIILNKNYRSGQEILDKAYTLIKHNDPNRLEVRLGTNKQLVSPNQKSGVAQHLSFATEIEETKGIVEKIKKLKSQNPEASWSDFAILVRANLTADKFTKELTRQGVPNLFVSLRGLYYKSIILDLLAYFKLLDNYHESSSLFRVLNMEIFKVAYNDIVQINKFARKEHWSLFEALKNINAVPQVSPEGVANIKKLLGYINEHSKLVKAERPSKIYIQFVRDCLVPGLDRDRDHEKYSYLNQLYRKIINFENNNEDARLKDFMLLIDLEMEAGETGSLKLNYEDSDTVKVMTVHAAKGLEFKYVFVANLVDKKFPTIRRKELIPLPDALVKEILPEGDVHIEEERRLFYVAITRAKDQLYLTSAKDYGGATDKRPSIFIKESGLLSEEVISDEASSDLLRDLEKIEIDEGILPYHLPQWFSFSQVQAFLNCPLQYKFGHVLKVPTEDKGVAVFGRLMHNCLKDFLTPLLDGALKQNSLFNAPVSKAMLQKEISLEKLISIYEKQWSNYGYQNKEEAKNYHKKGLVLLHNFYSDFENNIPQVMFLEKSFFLKIGEHQLRGVIDRIDRLEDGTVEIIDYKTGSPKEKLNYQDKKQLLIYHLALEEVFKLRVSKLTFHYLEGSRVSFAAEEKDIIKVKEEVYDIISEIKKLNFPPNPGFLCDFCDFKGICEFRKT
ncbi:MAG: UvrD-helicase domain-containing protein [bacterium]